MNYGYIAYRLKDSDTVVVDKNQIKNAKEEDFEEIRLVLPEYFIKEQMKRIENNADEEEYDDENEI